MTKKTTTFIGPDKVAEKIASGRRRAAKIPGHTERTAEIRRRMAEEDRVYAENLAAIRHAADLTQVALAERMGVAQTVVSRLERQHDMLLSTLGDYLAAAGDRPRVVVTINGVDVELDLSASS